MEEYIDYLRDGILQINGGVITSHNNALTLIYTPKPSPLHQALADRDGQILPTGTEKYVPLAKIADRISVINGFPSGLNETALTISFSNLDRQVIITLKTATVADIQKVLPNMIELEGLEGSIPGELVKDSHLEQDPIKRRLAKKAIKKHLRDQYNKTALNPNIDNSGYDRDFSMASKRSLLINPDAVSEVIDKGLYRKIKYKKPFIPMRPTITLVSKAELQKLFDMVEATPKRSIAKLNH